MSSNGIGPFAGQDVTRVELDDGLWVDIKAHLSHGDMRAIRQASAHALVKPQGVEAGGKVKLDLREDFALDADELEMVQRAVKAWNFPNGQGGIAPVNEATLSDLRDEVWNELVAAMNRQYHPMTEAEKKD